jgi:hypothetical protein
MAIIDLGRFGRFEIHRKPREREPPRPTQTERPSNLSPDDAFRYDRSSPAQNDPPPYSVIAPRPTPRPPVSRTYSNPVRGLYQIELEEERRAPRRELRSTFHEPRQQGPAQAAKPACKTQQLRRYIIEILALTLNADFDALNGALYDDESIRHTSSTLSADERAELRTLSSSVSYAWLMLRAGLRIDARRRHMIQDAIVRPSYAISRFGPMALNLIAWYGGQLSCPVRAWKDTVPGMWETTNRTIPVLARRDLERNESMKAFRIAIQDCSLNYKHSASLKLASRDAAYARALAS